MEKTLYFVLGDTWCSDECNWFDTIEEAKEYIQTMVEDDGLDAFDNKYYIYEGTAKIASHVPPVKAVFTKL